MFFCGIYQVPTRHIRAYFAILCKSWQISNDILQCFKINIRAFYAPLLYTIGENIT